MCLRIGDAIVCRTKNIKFCFCGRQVQFLCDWKVSVGPSGTCDKPLCANHAHEIERNKHLCAEHRAAFECWKRRHQVSNLAEYRARISGQEVLMFPDWKSEERRA